ncbi:MAG: hypothetical protein GY909_03075 [Oligoflexia bacterium]|nr:hypothetical protein [Oligoflexia bacterium]
MKIFGLFFMVSIFLTIHAQHGELSQEQQKNFKESDFQPHMLGHIYKGCPSNSHCSAKAGKLMHQWDQALANSSTGKMKKLFTTTKSIGVPFDLWSKKKNVQNREVISWDSSCPKHLAPNPELRTAVTFVKNLKELVKNEDLVLEPILIQDEKKIIKLFKPRGSSPMFYKKNQLSFLMSSQGSYYGLRVNSNLSLQVSQVESTPEYPRGESCPEILVKEWKKQDLPENLFLKYECSRIWNKDKKKYVTAIYGWTCHI